MSQPIRFFCPHCSLIIKIGPQMFGKTVVCPQCEKKVQVPSESDARAEKLYRFLKNKKTERKEKKRQHPTPPQVPAPESLAPIPYPSNGFDQHREEPEKALAEGFFEHLEPNDVDQWINEFWASVPEQERLNYRDNSNKPPIQSMENSTGLVGRVENSFSLFRNPQTAALLRFLLFLAFFVGCFLGFLLHAFIARNHSGSDIAVSSSAEKQKITVKGQLKFQKDDGTIQPDADAVILFILQDRVPSFQISCRGLSPDDLFFQPDSESIQQIEELGGVFLRAEADGCFSPEIPSKGRYVGLFISSHATRKEGDETIDPKTLADLRRFFRDPEKMLGDYCFSKDEYDFDEGIYVIRHTFRP